MSNFIHKITVRDWNYFSKTNDILCLKKYGVRRGNIEDLIEQVNENLGETIDFDKEKQKINSKFKIQELITYYRNLNHLLIHKLKVELWLLEVGIEKTNDNLDEVIKIKTDSIKSKYGIIIEKVEDLKKIDDEITRRLDKYAELTKETETPKEGVTFGEIVIGVFKVLGYEKIDYEMVLSDFFELKKQAAKTVK